MIIKARNESLELQLYRQLSIRSELVAKDSYHLRNLEKGFSGEKMFDRLLDQLTCNWLILNDLLLQISNSYFQIDKIIITSNKVFLLEIKNYEGDYYVKDDRWYMCPNKEIPNPLIQLQRSESSFRRLIQEHGYQFEIESYIIFVNSEFSLYHAHLNLPVVFPTQLKRFITKLTTSHSSFPIKQPNLALANKLLSLHHKEYTFANLPEYKFDKIEKGIICPECLKMYSKKSINGYLFCEFCSNKEKLEKAVLRSIGEYMMLFPDRAITIKNMVDWCAIVSKKYLVNTLPKHFDLKKHGRSSYYVKKNNC